MFFHSRIMHSLFLSHPEWGESMYHSKHREPNKQIPKYNNNSCLHNASGTSILKTYINTKMKLYLINVTVFYCITSNLYLINYLLHHYIMWYFPIIYCITHTYNHFYVAGIGDVIVSFKWRRFSFSNTLFDHCQNVPARRRTRAW